VPEKKSVCKRSYHCYNVESSQRAMPDTNLASNRSASANNAIAHPHLPNSPSFHLEKPEEHQELVQMKEKSQAYTNAWPLCDTLS
jgi:hypothetical protein